MLRWLLSVLLLCAAAPAFAQDRPLALIGATLIDGAGSPPITDAAIVIRGGRIVAVGPRGSVAIPRSALTLDVSGRWITPGLIDAHVHFFQSGGLYTRPDGFDLRDVVAYRSEVAQLRSRLDVTFARYVASGVTSVVDPGGPLWNFEVRRRSRNEAPAPRVAVAGPLIATAPRPSIQALDLGDPPIIYAEDVDAARRIARSQILYRPDMIKIWGNGTGPDGAARIGAITEAVVDIAHAAGIRVAVHAIDLEAARAAVEGGADILVHGVGDKPVDHDFIAALLERDVVYVTTIMVFEGYRDAVRGRPDLSIVERTLGDPEAIASLYEIPPELAARSARSDADARMRQMQENVVTLVRAGVRVAAGTDAGNIGTLHGPALHRELELLSEAGLTPMEVLQAATRDAAFAFEARPRMGVLRRGALADLLVLRADPLLDPRNLTSVERVYARGVGYEPSVILPASPESVVQEQLERFNAHDVVGFLATYANDAELYVLPEASAPFLAGVAQISAHYTARFTQYPHTTCRVLNRIVEGDFVIDQEFCFRSAEQPRLRGTVVYQVVDGSIRRAWFALPPQ